jgi:hypothetical protein
MQLLASPRRCSSRRSRHPFALPVAILSALLTFGAGAAAEPLQRPLYARPATTTSSFNMDLYWQYYDGLDLQEAKDFKGWTAGADFTLPLNDSMQLRFLLPVRTDARGQLLDSGEPTDLKGWGGTFQFGTIFFEHQLVGTDGGPNRFGYFLGAGWRVARLETSTYDWYNHQGRSIHAGVRYDRLLARGGTVLLNAEVRSYEVSDDLNPSSLYHDSFILTQLNAAWIGTRRGRLSPAVELTTNIVNDYVAASVVPEVFLRAGKVIELKLGVPVGLTADAPDWGTELKVSVTF